jgi:putative tricarboxylic transport membrane protein
MLLRAAPSKGDAPERADPLRAGAAIALCLGFAVGLVGRLPFWTAASAFIFVAILAFDWPERRQAGMLARGAVRAVVVAIPGALAIAFVFERVFLVRLP